MAFFKRKYPENMLGVDMGERGVKVVELSWKRERPILMTYGYAEHSLEETASILSDPKSAAILLADLVKEAGVESTRAVASLPQHEVFSTLVSVPAPRDRKELQMSIEHAIQKLTPLPLEEMVLDFNLLDGQEQEREEKKGRRAVAAEENMEGEEKKKEARVVRALVTGAPRALVERYVETFKRARLELAFLETESFALIRSLIGKDPSVILLLDIGENRTNIFVVEGGVPLVSRSINIGGFAVTRKIQEQMGGTLADAEQVKRDLAVPARVLGGETVPAVELLLSPIVHELTYTRGQFERQREGNGRPIEKIVLTGGSALLPGIVPRLSERLDQNVYAGDPWARVGTPEALAPVLNELGPRLAVAIGLAMRNAPVTVGV
jgi:type IV pilus assembly protein PilM